MQGQCCVSLLGLACAGAEAGQGRRQAAGQLVSASRRGWEAGGHWALGTGHWALGTELWGQSRPRVSFVPYLTEARILPQIPYLYHIIPTQSILICTRAFADLDAHISGRRPVRWAFASIWEIFRQQTPEVVSYGSRFSRQTPQDLNILRTYSHIAVLGLS